MNRRAWILTLAVAFVASLVAQGVRAQESGTKPGPYHRYLMKGNLVEVDKSEVYLCVGTRDGAAAGQQIDVFRYTRDRSKNPKSGLRFHREKVGRIEILEVVDEHFARARVLDGELREGDIAELEQSGG